MNQGKKNTHTHTQIIPNQENILLLITQQKLLFLTLPRDKSVYDKNKIKKKIENQTKIIKLTKTHFANVETYGAQTFT